MSNYKYESSYGVRPRNPGGATSGLTSTALPKLPVGGDSDAISYNATNGKYASKATMEMVREDSNPNSHEYPGQNSHSRIPLSHKTKRKMNENIDTNKNKSVIKRRYISSSRTKSNQEKNYQTDTDNNENTKKNETKIDDNQTSVEDQTQTNLNWSEQVLQAETNAMNENPKENGKNTKNDDNQTSVEDQT